MELQDRVRGNLEATIHGLGQVKAAISAAGFSEALVGYRQMMQTLQLQRLMTMNDPTLHDDWLRVSQAAAEASELLKPFVAVLDELAVVSTVSELSAIEVPAEK